jgi:hypothetical protein
MPKSEAFILELSARMAVRFRAHCIESGDDLGPFCVGFGRVDWVGVDGRLTGPVFFIAVIWLVQGREEEISHTVVEFGVYLRCLRTFHMNTVIEHEEI